MSEPTTISGGPVPLSNLSELFEGQVRRTPHALALCFGDTRVGYFDLNRRANRLAHALIARGAGPESVAGIALERSVELIVALLGVLKAGAAWLRWTPPTLRRACARCSKRSSLRWRSAPRPLRRAGRVRARSTTRATRSEPARSFRNTRPEQQLS